MEKGKREKGKNKTAMSSIQETNNQTNKQKERSCGSTEEIN